MQQPRRSDYIKRNARQTKRLCSVNGFYMDGKHLWELLTDESGKIRRRKTFIIFDIRVVVKIISPMIFKIA